VEVEVEVGQLLNRGGGRGGAADSSSMRTRKGTEQRPWLGFFFLRARSFFMTPVCLEKGKSVLGEGRGRTEGKRFKEALGSSHGKICQKHV
jgi:hypothetical protein